MGSSLLRIVLCTLALVSAWTADSSDGAAVAVAAAAADGLGGPADPRVDLTTDQPAAVMPMAGPAQSLRPAQAAWLSTIHHEQAPGEAQPEAEVATPAMTEPAVTAGDQAVESHTGNGLIWLLVVSAIVVAIVIAWRRLGTADGVAKPSVGTATISIGERKRPDSGFSLLEVMIALTILAGALLVTMDNVLLMDKAAQGSKENAKVQELMQVLAERLQGATWYGIGQRTQPWSWHRRDAADAALPPLMEAPHALADSFAGANPQDRWGPIGGGSAKTYTAGADQIATPGPPNGIPDCYDVIDDGTEVRNGATYRRYLALHNPCGDLWVWDPLAANRVQTGQGANILAANSLPQDVIVRGLGLVSSNGTGLPDVRIYLEYYNMVRDGVGLFDFLNGSTIVAGLATDRASFNANRLNYRLRVKNVLQETPKAFDDIGLNDLDTNDAVVMRVVVRWSQRNGGTAERSLVFARRK